ncbi:MAG: DUF4303 domain-containing protein [Verrucomicrobiota bacterium]
MGQGYTAARSWIHDASNPDYSILKKELELAISRLIANNSGNAVAIVTDSDFMTIGLAAHSFPDITAADDEELWVVDEWDSWIEDDQLDPAYRWLLAYGSGENDHLPHEVFHENVLRVFQSVLAELPEDRKVRLIYVGGDDCGHQWSAQCMDEDLSGRMLAWI